MCLYGQIKLILYQNRGSLSRLFSLITSCRGRDWLAYLDSIFAGLKYSFARDLQCYARPNSIYHAEMHEIEETDLWQAFLDP
mgnify:CR=1 FL=1